jgi:hypothetical protein
MDVVRDFLKAKGCADVVVRDGLEGLVRGWERVAASVAAGEEQFQDDYLNDMDGRQILADALAIATSEERGNVEPRVAVADQLMRSHLVPTQTCIWGDENSVKYGYDRERDWWYFHRPRLVESDWRDR